MAANPQNVVYKKAELLGELKKPSQSVAYFTSMVNYVSDAVIAVDHQGFITGWNAAAERIYGWKAYEALGEPFDDFLQTDYGNIQREDAINEVTESGTGCWSGEVIQRCKDGTTTPIWSSISIVLDDQGDPTGLICINRDIAEKKQTEKALRESEARFRSLYENATIGLYRTTPDGQILLANPVLVNLLGYSSFEELKQRNLDQEGYEPGYERTMFRQKIESDGAVTGLESAWTRKDGTTIFVRESAKAIRDAEGKVLYYEGTVEDISERKKAEQEIQQRTEDLLLINTLNEAANRGEDIEAIVEVFARETRKVFDCLAVAVYLISPDAKYIEMQSNTIPQKMKDKIEKLIGRPIPKVQIPLKEGSLLKQILGNERGTLLNNPRVIQQWIEEFCETTSLPPVFRPAIRRIVPRIYKILKIGSALSVPLISSGRTIGLMDMSSKGQFTEDDLQRIRSISSQVTAVLLRKQAEKQVHLQLQRLRALSKIDRAITSSLDMRLSLDVLLSEVLSQLSVDAASVLLLNTSSQTLEYLAGLGFRTTAIRQSRLRLGEEFAGQVGLDRKPVHVPDLAAAGSEFKRAELLKGEEFVEYFGVPLIAKGMFKGVLEIFQRTPLDPDSEWLNYLETLGGQAAIAIDNAQLFEGMQQSNQELIAAYDATIAGWSHAMDLRDKETEGHTQRVTELTLKLAEKMGVNQQEQAHVRRGALLHDIGKLGVPDHILLKPGKLTEEEWEIMRRHPTYALEMLSSINYLRLALDIPYCHHEKWDGSGYPRGLKGELIPLAARIFAVVDVWDALRTVRPYRASWSAEKTRAYILEQSGKHFDPRVVEAFLSMLDNE
jgi:PAS domain S-box-containing protein/putative nucleotidyltransferase with HDIG domain